MRARIACVPRTAIDVLPIANSDEKAISLLYGLADRGQGVSQMSTALMQLSGRAILLERRM